jgi:uncharacterized protein
MLIDLTKLLSQDNAIQEMDVPLELTHFKRAKGEQYKFVEKSPVHLVLEHEKDQVVKVTGHCSVACTVRCARCLAPVREAIDLDFEHRVNVSHPDADEDESEMMNCITEDKCLDVDQLVHNEILIHWPLRVLCKEDCKGICTVCGQDLNKGACSCNQEDLDPRMAAFREIFSNFKEV